MLTEPQKTHHIESLRKALTRPEEYRYDFQHQWLQLLKNLIKTKQKPNHPQLIPVWILLTDQKIEVRELTENMLDESFLSELIHSHQARHRSISFENHQLFLKDSRYNTHLQMINEDEPLFYPPFSSESETLYQKPLFNQDSWESIEEIIKRFPVTSLVLHENPFLIHRYRWWKLLPDYCHYNFFNLSQRSDRLVDFCIKHFPELDSNQRYVDDVDNKSLIHFCHTLQNPNITSLRWERGRFSRSDKTKLKTVGQAIRTSFITSLFLTSTNSHSVFTDIVCEAIAPGSKVEKLHLVDNIEINNIAFLAFCEALPKSMLRFLSLKSYSYPSILARFFESDWIIFLSAITRSRITSISFPDGHINKIDAALWPMFHRLICYPNLRNLGLRGNKLGEKEKQYSHGFNRTQWEWFGNAIMASSLISLGLSGNDLNQVESPWWLMFSEVTNRSSLKLIDLSNNSLGSFDDERFEAFIQFIHTCHISLNLSSNELNKWNIEQLHLFFEAVNQSLIPSLNLENNSSFWEEEKWPIFLNFIREAKTSLSLGSDFLDFISKFNLCPDFFGAMYVSRITSLHIENSQEEKYQPYRIELENILEQNARQSFPLHCPIVHSFWKRGYTLKMKSNNEVSVYAPDSTQSIPVEITEEDHQLLQEGERITAANDHLEIFVPQ